jgi:hypothetical protein
MKTARPFVKSTNPELYANNTFHMSKARKNTYNYAALDDYILQNWRNTTIKDMAKELNEYDQRIAYRIQVLKDTGLIRGKYNTERAKLVKRHNVLMAELLEIEMRIEGVA